jgi:hypothetical protein
MPQEPAKQVSTPGEPTKQGEQVVEVNAKRDADERSYRLLLRGLDVFEKNHALAPQARLHYKLFEKKPQPEHPLEVSISSDQGRIPLVLDADHSFALPRDEAAAAARATVRTNRKDGSLIWRVDVRTPGLASNQRRLGDLRLECEVNRIVDLINGFKPPSYLLLNATTNVCNLGGWMDVAEHPLFGVTLTAGKRREQIFSEHLYLNRIPVGFQAFYDTELRERSYWIKIGDRSWPDDTLLEFDYIDDGPPPGLPSGPPVQAQVQAGSAS